MHSSSSGNRKNVTNGLDETGLSGDLSPLTDIDEDDGFPSKTNRGPRGSQKDERRAKYAQEADALYSAFEIAASDSWNINQARRSMKAFQGETSKLDPSRLVVPDGTPPATHLQLLGERRYKIIKARSGYVIFSA
jgi:hypothetical protein